MSFFECWRTEMPQFDANEGVVIGALEFVGEVAIKVWKPAETIVHVIWSIGQLTVDGVESLTEDGSIDGNDIANFVGTVVGGIAGGALGSGGGPFGAGAGAFIGGVTAGAGLECAYVELTEGPDTLSAVDAPYPLNLYSSDPTNPRFAEATVNFDRANLLLNLALQLGDAGGAIRLAQVIAVQSGPMNPHAGLGWQEVLENYAQSILSTYGHDEVGRVEGDSSVRFSDNPYAHIPSGLAAGPIYEVGADAPLMLGHPYDKIPNGFDGHHPSGPWQDPGIAYTPPGQKPRGWNDPDGHPAASGNQGPGGGKTTQDSGRGSDRDDRPVGKAPPPPLTPKYVPRDTDNYGRTRDDIGFIGAHPILLDLDGDGIEITELDRSTTFMDASGSGLKHRTAWAGKGDGVLFWDGNNDGLISDDREYIFTEWDPTAGDDLAALRSRFDANGDGKLSGAELDGFKVMVTTDNGTLVARTVADNRIASFAASSFTQHFTKMNSGKAQLK